MAKVDLRKTVYNRDQFDRVVGGREFTTFTVPSDAITFTVEDFFNEYENLFLTIPVFGENNSHEYLVRKSSELVGFQRSNEDIQPLLDEIATLRDQLLQARQENINLQIEAAGGGSAAELTQQFNELLQALGEQPEINVNYLAGSENGESTFSLVEDTIRATISATGTSVPVEINVLANDNLPEDKEFTFLGIDSRPGYGSTVVIDTQNGIVKYTPNTDAPSGERIDSFTYRVRDEQGIENTGFVYVDITNIKATNQPPVANDDIIRATIDKDGTINPATINLLQNDIDPDSDEPLFFDRIVDRPKEGTLEILDPEVGIVQYKPNKRAPSGNKVDKFTYKIFDVAGASAIGTVYVNITNSYLTFATAGDDILGVTVEVTDTLYPNNSYTVRDNTVNVLDNDEGLDLIFDGIASNPEYGTVVSTPDGVVTYSPRIGVRSSGEIDLNAWFTPGAGVEPVLEDTFTYRVKNTNSGFTDTANVTVRINVVKPDEQPLLDDDPASDPANDPNINKDTDSTGRPNEPDPTNEQDPRNQPADNTNKTTNNQVTLQTF